ncbi:MAG: hypothetical protein JNK48_15965 [Bryobacterales bacterium]|nr:hypothetical protein [Bryobacterales bacterium]
MNYLDHLHEDTLEAYVMGKLPENDINSLEDHLLLCEHCQARTREVELDWKARRIALQRVREREGSRLSVFHAVWEGMFGSPAKKTGWAMACATAAVAMFLLVPSAQENSFSYRNVDLSSMRGGKDLSAPVQPDERLRLHLDLAELDQLSVYRVVIVNASGDLVWEAEQTNPGDNKLVVAVPKRLVSGTYWVRLLDRSASRRLLREYPLQLQ